MNKKNYSIQELAGILNVSVAAIRKKITTDPLNPSEKRYKKRYPVVIDTLNDRQVMQVLLSDIELQEEIRLARINKTKHSNETTLQETSETTLDDNVIDCEYSSSESETTINNNFNYTQNVNVLMEFTERYNNRLETYIERIAQAEGKQLLLEDKANREGLYIQEIKDAKAETVAAQNVTKNVVKYFTIVVAIMLLLLVASVCFLVYKLLNPTIIEKEIIIEKPVIQQVQPAVKKTGRR